MEREEHIPITRYIVGFTLLPFRIVGYFLKNVVWHFLARKKSFVEWSILVLSIVVAGLTITAIMYGDFNATKQVDDVKAKKTGKH
jgi:hypothetical protein